MSQFQQDYVKQRKCRCNSLESKANKRNIRPLEMYFLCQYRLIGRPTPDSWNVRCLTLIDIETYIHSVIFASAEIAVMMIRASCSTIPTWLPWCEQLGYHCNSTFFTVISSMKSFRLQHNFAVSQCSVLKCQGYRNTGTPNKRPAR